MQNVNLTDATFENDNGEIEIFVSGDKVGSVFEASPGRFVASLRYRLSPFYSGKLDSIDDAKSAAIDFLNSCEA